MEDKVTELMARQTQLTQRHGRLGPLLERAEICLAPRPAGAGSTSQDARLDGRPSIS